MLFRSVIEKDGKLLLIYTNQGDYKFPGGGYKNSENAAECIVREMLEETGYQVEKVGKLFGIVLEQKVDDFEPGTYFSMKSEYYSVTIDENNKQKQNLDDYEKEQEFRPVFGIVLEQKVDDFEPGTYFSMKSEYYSVTIEIGRASCRERV